MSGLRYGELFAGYDGLGMGVRSVLGGSTAWFSEFDKAPSAILAHHYPDVPNHGDITKIDWSRVEPVDVLTGGFPCQDVSHAGRRAGLIRDGEGRTRSGLWGHMLRAIDELRPRLVVAENVRGLLSAQADSDMEPCPFCMGDAGVPPLRALGAVLGDLADVGFDAAWYGLRAADVGAAHGRFRVFIFAWPADAAVAGLQGLADQAGAAQARLDGHAEPGAGGPPAASGLTEHGLDLVSDVVAGGILPGVDGDQGGKVGDGFGAEGDRFHVPILVPDFPADQTSWGKSDQDHALLPTPAVNDMGEGKTPEAWDEWTAKMQAAHGNGNGHGKSLAIEAQRLLPTPTTADHRTDAPNRVGSPSLSTDFVTRHLLPAPRATDGTKGGPNQAGSSGDLMLPSAVQPARWGDYAPAIARWETVIGRPAPAPTEPGRNGNPRLSPLFVEWLMGLPAGHVTDPAIGITRNHQLKALGNGVVPAQSAAATRAFLEDFAQIGAAA